LNKFKRYLFVFLCSAALTACSNTKTSAVFTPEHSSDTETIVYIYRPGKMANAMYSPDLYINNEYRAPIKNGSYYHFTLTPGQYSFRLEGKDKISGNRLDKKILLADTVYYYRVNSTLMLNASSSYQPYQRGFTLLPVETISAENQIAECCLNKDLSTMVKENSSGSNSSFSVDKTQNPFSH